jgi:apolipoprotein D and lipocalin family protein
MRKFLISILVLLQTACTGLPEGIQPVEDFQLESYLGTWYEIARLDHSFERGLSNVTAEYTLLEDGGVKVINRGFSNEAQEWKIAEGKAYFVDDKNKGHLKVSFFGPFYGSYVIFDLDKPNYQYAIVTSYNQDYLWLLARTPTVSEEIMKRFNTQTKNLGFNTEQIIFVEQSTVLLQRQ